jgi:curved DNA-binding protein CbpA
MDNPIFIDHYELLQVSQTADTETIERVFRLLAKRYHPDNAASGSASRFNEVHTACTLLSNPEKRAQYDVQYDQEKTNQWQVFDQSAAGDDRNQDQRLFHGILSLLYVARRRDPEAGGMGEYHLERTLATPREHLAFPLWYLKKRGWIERLENGVLAITVDGVDMIGSRELSLPNDRLLAESSSSSDKTGGAVSDPPELADRPSNVTRPDVALVS